MFSHPEHVIESVAVNASVRWGFCILNMSAVNVSPVRFLCPEHVTESTVNASCAQSSMVSAVKHSVRPEVSASSNMWVNCNISPVRFLHCDSVWQQIWVTLSSVGGIAGGILPMVSQNRHRLLNITGVTQQQWQYLLRRWQPTNGNLTSPVDRVWGRGRDWCGMSPGCGRRWVRRPGLMRNLSPGCGRTGGDAGTDAELEKREHAVLPVIGPHTHTHTHTHMTHAHAHTHTHTHTHTHMSQWTHTVESVTRRPGRTAAQLSTLSDRLNWKPTARDTVTLLGPRARFASIVLPIVLYKWQCRNVPTN